MLRVSLVDLIRCMFVDSFPSNSNGHYHLPTRSSTIPVRQSVNGSHTS